MEENKKEIQNEVQNFPETIVEPEKKKKKERNFNKLNQAFSFLQERFDFRFNEITAELEYRLKDQKEFRFFDEYAYNEMVFRLNDANINVAENLLKSILYSVNCEDYIGKRFNPFKEYILNLPRWNEGDPDFIQIFLQQIQLKEESSRNYLNAMFKKWIVGMIVSLIDDEPNHYKVNQLAFIMVGGQGKFKSTFLQRLLPEEWRKKYYYDSTFNFNNKDHELLIGTKAIINLDELSSFNKTDIDLIKSKITQPQIEVRPPYGRTSIRLKRRASFCGSINHREFLRDETGNRRWFVVQIDNIQIDPDFDISLIYSQALYYKEKGFHYWVDQEDIVEIEKENEKFIDRSMEEENILRYFKKPEKDDFNSNTVQYLSASEIADYISTQIPKYNINGSVKRGIGRALGRHNFINKSRRTDNGIRHLWEVVKINIPLNAAVDDPIGREGDVF